MMAINGYTSPYNAIDAYNRQRAEASLKSISDRYKTAGVPGQQFNEQPTPMPMPQQQRTYMSEDVQWDPTKPNIPGLGMPSRNTTPFMQTLKTNSGALSQFKNALAANKYGKNFGEQQHQQPTTYALNPAWKDQSYDRYQADLQNPAYSRMVSDWQNFFDTTPSNSSINWGGGTLTNKGDGTAFWKGGGLESDRSHILNRNDPDFRSLALTSRTVGNMWKDLYGYNPAEDWGLNAYGANSSQQQGQVGVSSGPSLGGISTTYPGSGGTVTPSVGTSGNSSGTQGSTSPGLGTLYPRINWGNYQMNNRGSRYFNSGSGNYQGITN